MAIRILQPQLRRTSEVRYHSDLAPGRRFLFAGRVVDPACRLYIAGRQVDEVPADQAEWLDDHRHNCPTFYVLIGRNPDLSGLAAEVVIEGRRFAADSPSAIMLPPGYRHHHRLTAGGGWSFHVNARSDYEESLLDESVDAQEHAVDVDRLYRRAEPASPAAYAWETSSGSIAQGQSEGLRFWKFIDPDEFEAPGVRLHAASLSTGPGGRWIEAAHRHALDEVTILLSDRREPLVIETASGEETATLRSPVAVYVPEDVSHRHRHIAGEGLALKFLRLPPESS